MCCPPLGHDRAELIAAPCDSLNLAPEEPSSPQPKPLGVFHAPAAPRATAGLGARRAELAPSPRHHCSPRHLHPWYPAACSPKST